MIIKFILALDLVNKNVKLFISFVNNYYYKGSHDVTEIIMIASFEWSFNTPKKKYLPWIYQITLIYKILFVVVIWWWIKNTDWPLHLEGSVRDI